MPADVSAVAYADVRDIMDSEFRQKLREVMPTGAEKDRLLEETGIDIEHDIDTVMAGLTGTDVTGPLVLMSGRFDAESYRSPGRQPRRHARNSTAASALLVGLTDASMSVRQARNSAVHRVSRPGPAGPRDAAALRRAIDVAASGQDVASNARDDALHFVRAGHRATPGWWARRRPR